MVEEREGKRENEALGHTEIRKWSLRAHRNTKPLDSLEVGEYQFGEVSVPNISQILTFRYAV
jgi:hypothetical protein